MQHVADSVADAHRDDGTPFIVCADEKLSVFVELESVVQAPGKFG